MMGDDKRTFYEQYDDELQSRLVEEIIYYNRQLDLQIVFVNGVIMTPHNEPNPRKDKNYPFARTVKTVGMIRSHQGKWSTDSSLTPPTGTSFSVNYTFRNGAIVSTKLKKVDDGGKIIEEKDEYGDYVENPDVIFPVKRVEK